MQPLQEGFSALEKERICEQHIKIHSSQELSPYLNPHQSEYWTVNGALLTVMAGLRHHCQVTRKPTLVYSVAIVALPFFALMTTSKLDKRRDYHQHRKTLEDRLEYHPIARNAWESACNLNDTHQDNLRQEIEALKAKLI